MVKREAFIHVPVWKNDGSAQPLSLYNLVQDTLVRWWGGCHHYGTVTGSWRAPDGTIKTEPMQVLAVAMEDTPLERMWLQDLAWLVAHEGQQEEVYIVHAAGDVEFVKADKLPVHKLPVHKLPVHKLPVHKMRGSIVDDIRAQNGLT